MKEKIRKWFRQGLWTEKMVRSAVEKGVLTGSQADEIVKEAGGVRDVFDS